MVASGDQLANPVCIEIGPNFEIYVGETYRQETGGVPDNRAFPEWLADDLRLQTVAERAQMYMRHHPELHDAWTKSEDRIVLLRDIDGDFIVDKSTTYAGEFNGLEMGTGAGLLLLDGDLFYTCIPSLWKLRDTDGDDVSDIREELHSGFGVRVAFRGHDMHGLTRGSFGRIYWSIGDRGYNVTTSEGVNLSEPGRGAVFRCWPDGSELEVFSTGLRNPQELAFDDYGNLFTVDNNCDAGDRARLVYLHQGSDSGWRMNFQYLPDRGPWMSESWWDAANSNPPQFLNLPLANITAGPSGLVHYPGVGLGPEYDNSFFVADFRGGADYSGIVRFEVRSDGAGFAFKSEEDFWWKVLATDVTFAPDGAMYISDWISGWVGHGTGNIFRADFADADIEAQQQSRNLLGCDISKTKLEALIELLNNKDSRVRQRAQFELEERQSVPQLHALAINEQKSTISRSHALWALTSMSRRHQRNYLPFACFNSDKPEIRAQVLRSANEIHADEMEAWFVKGLADTNPRVQYFAALGLAHYPGHHEKLYRLADTPDFFLRSALVEALAAKSLDAKIPPAPTVAQRMLKVLVLRKLRSERLRESLSDPNQSIVDEAICAIYDRNIEECKTDLAALDADHQKYSKSSVRRILACKNFFGTKEFAQQLFTYATNPMNPESLLSEVATYLEKWVEPNGFDMVLNEWQEFPQRDVSATSAMTLDFSETQAAGPIARGRLQFAENALIGCTRCHSLPGVTPDGFVNPAGPDLQGVGSRFNKEQLREVIVNPRPESAMPKDFQSKMSEDQLSDLIHFLQSQKDQGSVINLPNDNELQMLPVTTAEGKTIYMSATEISWETYDLFFLREDEQIEIDGVSGPSHSVFPVTRGYGHDGMPALGMTYSAAQNFCAWFSEQQQHPYRLATAAEWRAALGDQKISALEGWLASNSDGVPHQIASKKPNANGFFDMVGNVEEWVVDVDNPQGTTLGGSFVDDETSLIESLQDTYRISWQARDPQWPKSSWWMSDAGFVGFRIVCDSKP